MTIQKALKSKVLAAFAVVGMAASLLTVPAFAAETTEAEVTFTPGELRMVSAPSIDFGSNQISGNSSYVADSVDGVLQVSDLRGSGDGWEVTAELGEFQKDDNSATLQGASIVVANANNGVSNPNGAAGAAPTAPSSITLEANTPASVFKAEDGQGAGVWDSAWQSSDVTLVANPSTIEEGHASANINWAFTVAP